MGISGVYAVEGLGRGRVRRRRCVSVEIICDAEVFDEVERKGVVKGIVASFEGYRMWLSLGGWFR